jgi:hypothetical protein
MQAGSQQEAITANQKLDALLKNRWHGAVNIRGIRYQILYSLFRAFDLYKKDSIASSIRLEGIEDVDLVGFRCQNEYVQVKSADKSWDWNQLKKPIKGFLEVSCTDLRSRFVLAVNFPLAGDIDRLSKRESLSRKDKRRIEEMFRKLCGEVGASPSKANDLLRRLSIVSVPEEQIWKQLRPTVTETFELGSEAVDTYISALIAKFLDWAKERKTVTLSELESVRAAVGEALARETEFQAYGRGFIGRVSWESDANSTDFFEGKGTRPGHIVAGVDIKRPTWLEKIDTALNTSKVCVLRASSGQGKSTLLYQYAYEKCSPENIFLLRVAQLPEHVELVRNYLQFRARLGLPVLLVIDNAGWQTQLWPSVAQECAALGVRVLVTVRDEDWQRFAKESLTSYEILEPTLDLEEARQIFKSLQAQGRVHTSVDSPEWAYERIGESHLLMEYVYLLTQGRMLEERLRDQIKQFSQQQEDPAKIEILRRTTLAEALGTPVLVDKLLQNITFTGDQQQILQSLSGEYLKFEGEVLIGLHWVRSNCLAQILHEGYPNPAITALAILEAVPLVNLSKFVSNAICRQGLNVEVFVTGLVEKAKNVTIDIILAFLVGLFEAGERQFFQANQNLFDEAYEILGSNGSFLLSSEFMPVVKVDTIARMIEILGEKGENFRKLEAIASKAVETPRGLDLCKDFLNEVGSYIQSEILKDKWNETGKLLDWCALCATHLPAWQNIRDDFLTSTAAFDLSATEFCNFAQGLYRYDSSTYQDWLSRNQKDVLSYLKLHTDCIKLELSERVVSVEFFPDGEKDSSTIEQVMSRLDRLRSALPFCERYRSQGIWLLPFGLKPSVDDTHKDIPQENLHFKSDIEKNVVWRKIAQWNYVPDSYYKYEEAWYTLRKDSLLLVQELLKALKKAFSGRKTDPQTLFEGGQLLVRLEKALKYTPSLSIDNLEALEALGKSLSLPLKIIFKENATSKWYSSFHNFFFQLFEYIGNKDLNIGRLVVHNFKDATKHLAKMHTAFAQLFQDAPDYFGARELNVREIDAYCILSDLLEIWILEQPGILVSDILQYIQANKDLKRQELLHRFQEALAPLQEYGITLILPLDVYVEYPLHYMSLAFSVANPCQPETELIAVITAITKIKDIAEFFCLIPVHEGTRFLEGGYQISSLQISALEDGCFEQWETFAARELPEGVLKCLPPLPFRPVPKQQFRANLLGLFFGVQLVIERRERLESLKASGNHFETELYERHKAKLRNLEEGLRVTTSQIKNQLRTELLEREDEPNYITVQGFLETLEEALRQDTLNDLLASGYCDSENITDALDKLLKEW